MLLRTTTSFKKSSHCMNFYGVNFIGRYFSQVLDKAYTDDQKQKILQVMNDSDDKELLRYDIAKSKVKKICQWKNTYGSLKSISDIELIDGFAENNAKKLYDSILKGPQNTELVTKVTNKIKGQILQPSLVDSVRQKCKLVLTVYVSVNSVCWMLIEKTNYEVLEWEYYNIDFPESKRLQITDIMQIAWRVTRGLPHADLYVMKAEATTLRASGSDPNNPKVLAVNLQKSQMISMMVALINARSNQLEDIGETNREPVFKHKVYFLRPSLPYRLYGTLVGNEKVSTDQTVELLLQDLEGRQRQDPEYPVPKVSEELKSMFRNQKELQRDMLGHCFLLALTFMDLCIYKNQDSINRLLKRGE